MQQPCDEFACGLSLGCCAADADNRQFPAQILPATVATPVHFQDVVDSGGAVVVVDNPQDLMEDEKEGPNTQVETARSRLTARFRRMQEGEGKKETWRSRRSNKRK